MRRLVMLAAMLAAVGLAPQPADAGDRGFGFGHFSPHPSAKLHQPHHRFGGHHRHAFGKHRHFKHRHFAQPGFVLKYRGGDFAFSFGHVQRPGVRHFGHRHDGGGLVLRFGQSWHPWQDRGLAFGHPYTGAPRTPGGAIVGHAPLMGSLGQLDAMGFRYVPRLLEERSAVARRSMNQRPLR